nr:hypothetical protein CFP56_09640 [Quercus suber]
MAILTTLDFLANRSLYQREKPFVIYPPAGGQWTADDPDLRNVQWEPFSVEVNDMRDLADVGLDTSGFEIVHHQSPQCPGLTASTLKTYAEEMQAVLKAFFEAEYVVCFDYTRFRSLMAQNKRFRIVKYVHLAIVMLKQLLLNMWHSTWRPLIPKIEDRPLACCDYRSVNLDDCLAVDIVYPNRQQELYYIRQNNEQKWFWFPEQTPTDLLLMKMYDSSREAIAKCRCSRRIFTESGLQQPQSVRMCRSRIPCVQSPHLPEKASRHEALSSRMFEPSHLQYRVAFVKCIQERFANELMSPNTHSSRHEYVVLSTRIVTATSARRLLRTSAVHHHLVFQILAPSPDIDQ